ncbi:bacterioferritin [Endozoicomonas sp. 8E]|uniref:bacterioferritin n=1 Tax=Endozoicomonas sp. 8E TaxID=3035692 RepID=UPI0029392B00|nr:bacterioferritin [Endozoicomonas sp. 8E]WOG29257.1 bacterioferritin [Endozoicomonas sp. 8E]
MQGEKGVLDHLNQVLMNELTAINQYFLHARMLKNWGVNKLGQYIYKESIDEMWHADWLIERILFLEGMPDFKYMQKPIIAADVKGILEADLQQELKAIPPLKEAIDVCEKVGDYGSRQLLEKILAAEEEHMDSLEVHLYRIKTMGMENYLLSQSEED